MERIVQIEENISIIPEIIRKPNSLSVLLFVQNISKLLTRLPPRRLSSILWPIFRHGFRI